ncbi:hypothetical protein PsorP6_017917 [Peronosclerospora sorghi]|uniref:Uncharacterized protein n=1 Tax=Peronosclerospora sorghi TaxID=230839 RepID=A0ACC0WBJ6_9STRA|nr:hypothetical protein PsorP6_017917 [Peronosclerospora sorghi]
MPAYLKELPNNENLTQELAHPGKDTTQYTEFAMAFSEAGKTWSPEFCKAKFPGASMTNGEAFGDPCCTWKKGGKPDFTIEAFTTTPTKATKCPSGGDETGESTDPKQSHADNAATKEGKPKEGDDYSEPPPADAATKEGEPKEGDDYSEPPPADAATKGDLPPTGEGAASPPPSSGGCTAKPYRKLRR